MRSRSLRTRLVATLLLLLAVASAVVALVTALTLRGFLLSRLDGDLRVSSRVLARIDSDSTLLPPLDAEERPGLRPADSLSAVLRHGQVLSAWVFTRDGGVQPVSPEEYPDLAAVPVDHAPLSADLGPLGVYRLVALPGGSGDVIVTGFTERTVQDTVARLVTTELIVAAVTLLGAGLTGAVLVRRELEPLERVAATAARVSTLQLDRGEVSLVERVPDTDPHTEVGQVGAALNHMLDHVGAALEARQDSETRLRQFVADASHELRTPLAAIRGYAELSRRGELPADAEYALVRISAQSERMTTLVEDLLLLARLDAGRPLERREVDLTRLVVDAVSDAHAAGPGHRWQLDLPEEPVTVPGDALRLAQVLANLLANARTHTPQGTTVTVALAVESAGARLEVVDDGPGIAPELLPHVFERFARGSTSRSRANGSSGLGLAIVDAVVAAHGGSVRVASVPGRSAFIVRLPSVAPEQTVPLRVVHSGLSPSDLAADGVCTDAAAPVNSTDTTAAPAEATGDVAPVPHPPRP
ncbi:HAMP domain-containing sensor histidine kinase [Pseudonocardia yunnanensis]|uniref:histidine kinase n=1 Tax=Pseudonocardia yunnanensis TaxID=58107 RepID=A0ABW4EQ22_9PSEU